jgi:hypothetical protein
LVGFFPSASVIDRGRALGPLLRLAFVIARQMISSNPRVGPIDPTNAVPYRLQMPPVRAGTRIAIPGRASGRSGFRFDGGEMVISATDAARISGARPRRGGYQTPGSRFEDDAFRRGLAEHDARLKERRRQIDEATGVRSLTPEEAAGRARWEATRGTSRMSWEEFQRDILNADSHKPKRVASGGVRTQAQAERLADLLSWRGAIDSITLKPIAPSHLPEDRKGGVALNGPLQLVDDRDGRVNLFWKSGQVYFYEQSFDVVGAEKWNWYQCDPKEIADLLKGRER